MKLLFFPAPAHGHVNPMLPLAQELVSRGDEVIFYVTREFEAAARETGASLRLIDDRLTVPSTLPKEVAGQPVKHLLPMVLDLMNRGMREAPHLAEEARAEQADGVVYDPMAVWGRVSADLLRLPTAIFQTSFALSHSPTLQRTMKKTMRIVPTPGPCWACSSSCGTPRCSTGVMGSRACGSGMCSRPSRI